MHLDIARMAALLCAAASAVPAAGRTLAAQAYTVQMQGTAHVVLPAQPVAAQEFTVSVQVLSPGLGQWIAGAFSGQPGNAQPDVTLYGPGASVAMVLRSAHVRTITLSPASMTSTRVGLTLSAVAVRVEASTSAPAAELPTSAPFTLALNVVGLGVLHPKALAAQTLRAGNCQDLTMTFDGADYPALQKLVVQTQQMGRASDPSHEVVGRLVGPGGAGLLLEWSGIVPTKITTSGNSNGHPSLVTTTFSCSELRVTATGG